MISLSYKAKQSTWFALKGIILIGAFYFLVTTFQHKLSESYSLLKKVTWIKGIPWLLLFVCMALLNWFFEILKWRLLVSNLQKISLKVAAQQSLAAHCVSIITPNKIGEFGAKASFFPSYKRKRILLLTLTGNMAQLFATLLFGIIGILLLNPTVKNSIQDLFSKTQQWIIISVVLTVLLFVIAFYKKEWFIKGLSLEKVAQYILSLPVQLKLGALGYSLLRYLLFSFLFYGIYSFLGGTTALWSTLAIIYTTYLLSSIIPVFNVVDVIIKGSVAVWLFQFLGSNEWIVLATAFIMWMLNIALPAIIGGLILLKIKPQ